MFLSFSNPGEVLLPWHPLLPLSVPAPDCSQPSPVLRVPCLPPAQGPLLHSSLLLAPVPCACSFPNRGVSMEPRWACGSAATGSLPVDFQSKTVSCCPETIRSVYVTTEIENNRPTSGTLKSPLSLAPFTTLDSGRGEKSTGTLVCVLFSRQHGKKS